MIFLLEFSYKNPIKNVLGNTKIFPNVQEETLWNRIDNSEVND